MKQPCPIVHVGYPKCASTTIQHNFLAKQPRSVFITRQASSGDARYWELYESLSKSLTKGVNLPAARLAWKNVRRENESSRHFIFSDERLTLPRRHSAFTSILERPYLVRQLFGEARIILVLREPHDYLRSLYQQMAVNTYRKDKTLPEPFQTWLESDIVAAKYKQGATSQGLYFGEIAIRYSEFFGKQNVGVFFLEDLKADSSRFFQSMAEFLQIERPFIPPPEFTQNKNVTAEKELMSEIAKNSPHFEDTSFPESFLAQTGPFLRMQARYLRGVLNVDAYQRWPQG